MLTTIMIPTERVRKSENYRVILANTHTHTHTHTHKIR